ncbi:MAG: peptide chain release factor N(5)-glutamine methyltransferase [Candidatus Moranbacteria bacterium]|nr:peptide chain release factor N(5)-glutamine methyltransferase [Candidatus Moranbacteria bacterium]MDD3965161.1 peptide chain release factor N(5)-glutamine methyltransferase [Candidatus Moranbacteria bacterium]
MTIKELQNEFLSAEKKYIDPIDFFLLIAHTLKKEKIFILTHPEYEINSSEEKNIRNNILRRIQHEPIAYITGSKEFYGYDFTVTKDTLIPRPETEQIVELVIESVHNQQLTENKEQKIAIIDIGTGSGNIIISIVKEIKKQFTSSVSNISFYALDISLPALVVAKENAKKHAVENNIEFYTSDLLEGMKEKIPQTDILIITANLPYVSHTLYENTPPDVHNFEPMTALISEEDGLAHYHRLLKKIKQLSYTKQSFFLLLEMSPEQSLPLSRFISDLFPQATVHIHQDLAQKDRIVSIILSRL